MPPRNQADSNPGDAAADAALREDAERDAANQRPAPVTDAPADGRPADDDVAKKMEAEQRERVAKEQRFAKEDAEEQERRRQFDGDRAARRAAAGLDVIHANAVTSGAMEPGEADKALDAAMASRGPMTALTGALGFPGMQQHREVGPNGVPNPVQRNSTVHGPGQAMGIMPAGSGQKVTSQDPRFEGQSMVNMTFPQAMTLTLDDHSQIQFRPGTQQVPESLVDHWYLRSAGARKYG